MMYTTIALLTGIVLDFLLGDPFGAFHPVVWMGKLIAAAERRLRSMFPKTARGRYFAGVALWFLVVLCAGGIPACILYAAWRVHPWLYGAVAAWMSYQIMATKSLRTESMKVYGALQAHDLPQARRCVSMIVGRDTDRLDASGVARAAVETVAENTSDGCIAPLFYLAVGGPVAGFFYKAVNTMDSMVGYRNETYMDFGRFAARMDDFWNFVPARLAALFMTAAAFLCGMDGGAAWRIYRRDRKKSPSPNAAQTESVCAGALGIRLLGDTSYFGKIHHKETIGDACRAIEPEDIRRANRLLYATVLLAAACALALRLLFFI